MYAESYPAFFDRKRRKRKCSTILQKEIGGVSDLAGEEEKRVEEKRKKPLQSGGKLTDSGFFIYPATLRRLVPEQIYCAAICLLQRKESSAPVMSEKKRVTAPVKAIPYIPKKCSMRNRIGR